VGAYPYYLSKIAINPVKVITYTDYRYDFWHMMRFEIPTGLVTFHLLQRRKKRSRSSDKKTPAEVVLADCLESFVLRWGPYWSFRRFGLTDAAHRSKEGSPFVSVDSERNHQSSRPQGNWIVIGYLTLLVTIPYIMSEYSSDSDLVNTKNHHFEINWLAQRGRFRLWITSLNSHSVGFQTGTRYW